MPPVVHDGHPAASRRSLKAQSQCNINRHQDEVFEIRHILPDFKHPGCYHRRRVQCTHTG